jgi:hypothetical protein
MSSAVDSIAASPMVVPAAFGADAPAAGVSPAEFAAVFRQYSENHAGAPCKDAHLNMGLRVVAGTRIDEPGVRSWWAA